MLKCSKCGRHHKSSETFCPFCSSKVPFKKALTVVAAGFSSMVLMACYGCPNCTYHKDVSIQEIQESPENWENIDVRVQGLIVSPVDNYAFFVQAIDIQGPNSGIKIEFSEFSAFEPEIGKIYDLIGTVKIVNDEPFLALAPGYDNDPEYETYDPIAEPINDVEDLEPYESCFVQLDDIVIDGTNMITEEISLGNSYVDIYEDNIDSITGVLVDIGGEWVFEPVEQYFRKATVQQIQEDPTYSSTVEIDGAVVSPMIDGIFYIQNPEMPGVNSGIKIETADDTVFSLYQRYTFKGVVWLVEGEPTIRLISDYPPERTGSVEELIPELLDGEEFEQLESCLVQVENATLFESDGQLMLSPDLMLGSYFIEEQAESGDTLEQIQGILVEMSGMWTLEPVFKYASFIVDSSS